MRFFKSFEFVLLLAALMGLSAFGIDAVLPTFPELSATFSLHNDNRIHWVVYVFMLGFSLMQLLFGILADFLGRKRLLLLGLLIYALASLSVFLVESFAGLLCLRFLQGAGLAAPRVISQAVVRDVISGREMARVLSFSMMVFLLVPVLAPSVGQVFLMLGSWKVIFYLFAFLGLLMIFWVALRLPETLPYEKRNAPNLRNLKNALLLCFVHRPTFVFMMLLSALFAMMMIYIGQAEQIYGSSVYRLGERFVFAFGATALGMVLASFVNSQVVMRLGMHRIVFFSLSVMLVVDSLLLLSALYFSGKPPLFVFMVLLIAHFFCYGLTMPNVNSLILEPHGRTSGAIAAISGTLMSLLGLAIAEFVSKQFNGTVLPLAWGFWGLVLLAWLGNFYVGRLRARGI